MARAMLAGVPLNRKDSFQGLGLEHLAAMSNRSELRLAGAA